MGGKKGRRALICIAALGTTALLGLALPRLAAHIAAPGDPNPPGVRTPSRQLITVWIAGELPGASLWLRRQAAAFSRAEAGVSVWLRAVSRGEMEQMGEAAPDAVIFSADVRLPAEALQPCPGAEAVGEQRARRGQWGGEQLAVPLCMSGYVLAERDGEQAARPTPRSLFGVTPTAAPRPAPALRREAPWPLSIAADNGFGALALCAMGAPAGARILEKQAMMGAFAQEAKGAALLSLGQARTAENQGTGYRVFAAAPATDLVLYASLAKGAQEAAGGFVRWLLSREAQAALGEQGLLPARQELWLYGEEQPAPYALEAALREGWLAPAFLWAEEGADTLATAQALYAAGQDAAVLLR